MRKSVMLVLVGLAACAVGCTSGPPDPAAGPASTTGTTSGTTSGTATGSGLPSPSTVPPAPGEPPGCAETAGWGTGLREGGQQTTDALFEVRAGRHGCYDRVVFDIAGATEVGYHIGYVPVVAADGSGEPVPVPGTAALQVVVRAPPQGFDDAGQQQGTPLARTGDYFYTESQLAGWQSLRAVRFAGFFEGQCMIAVGVAGQLPFQVTTQLDDTNRIRRLILDIAHP
ncbi:MAG TPA: hypothetical protein VFV67_09855 [Actinophytocola sp.]|uniref:AMIN-like domain-containing (lipo)protein n=1 Tax=Actinophytocola sp. TaxID=1872138 RepID=UPI002DBFD7BA|nr:hypothetical protein [Actinophytocola sp.]HEU5470944.1 hypothetical protein [Actinophytocola sp.]